MAGSDQKQQQDNNDPKQEATATGSQSARKKQKATTSKAGGSTTKQANLTVNLPKIPKTKPAKTVSHCPSDDEDGAAAVWADDHTGHRSPLDALTVHAQNPWMPPAYGHMAGYYPMFQPPPWQWHDDMSYNDGDYDEPQQDAETVSDNGGSDEENDDDTTHTFKKSVIKSDLLASHKNKFDDDEGAATNEEVAELVNQIWSTKQEKDTVKELFKKHKKPANINAQKVNVNEEVVHSIPKSAKSRDMQLRSVQGIVAKTAVPLVESLARLINVDEELDRQKLVDSTVDGITLLAHANQQLNQMRRDMLRPTVHPKYQPLCYKAEGDSSKLLFGEKLMDRIRGVSQGGKMARRGLARGSGYAARGRYQPYQYPAYPTYHGYGRGRGASRPPFLGKSLSQVSTSITKAEVGSTENIIPDCQNVYTIQSGCRPAATKQQGPRSEATDAVNQDDTDSSDRSMVGKYMVSCATVPFEPGKLASCVHEWRNLTSDTILLKSIRGFGLEFTSLPTQPWPQKPFKFSDQEQQFLVREINRLTSLGVIEKASHVEGEFISNIFLREKKDNKYRMILNLKQLNKFVDQIHFKMDTLLTAISMVTPGCWFLSIDFQDAYYSVAVAVPLRKYLRFLYQGQLYEFTCLPNGLTSAPRLFTKILKVPLSHIRQNTPMNVTGYLDDTLFVADSPEILQMGGTQAGKLFQTLGFAINRDKSVLSPTQTIEFLGFIISSKHMSVSLAQKKVDKLTNLIKDVTDKNWLSIRQFSSIVGKLRATEPANPWANLFTMTFEIEKLRALSKNSYNYDAFMQLSVASKVELRWWLDNLDTIKKPVHRGQPTRCIFTDASNEGWGCFDSDDKTSCGGRWTAEESKNHINFLEIKAIYLALQSKCKHWTGEHVRIMCDNTTAVANVTKQGSIRSKSNNHMTRKIWDFAIERNLWLSIAHCPGSENTEADRASRVFQDEIEWSLAQGIFDRICDCFGKPDIDLFASRLNHKVPRYCSWQQDPGAVFVDSFLYNWGQGQYVYIFPPFAILHRALQKIQLEGAEGIIIVPHWPTKPWFSQLGQLLVQEPLSIPVTEQVLSIPGRKKTHPMTGRMELLACHFSSDLSRRKAFQQQRLEPSLKQDANLLRDCMTRISRNGPHIVVNGTLIPCTQV